MHPHEHVLDILNDELNMLGWMMCSWCLECNHLFLWCCHVYVFALVISCCLLPWMRWYDMHDRCMLGLMWVAMIDVC